MQTAARLHQQLHQFKVILVLLCSNKAVNWHQIKWLLKHLRRQLLWITLHRHLRIHRLHQNKIYQKRTQELQIVHSLEHWLETFLTQQHLQLSRWYKKGGPKSPWKHLRFSNRNYSAASFSKNAMSSSSTVTSSAVTFLAGAERMTGAAASSSSTRLAVAPATPPAPRTLSNFALSSS